MSSPAPETSPPRPTRRAMVRTASWAVPVAAAATAAPALAASTTCARLGLPLTPPGNNAVSNPLVLPATGGTAGQGTYEVRITSTLQAGTADRPTANGTGVTYNLSRNASGWAGGASGTGTNDYVYTGFGPVGSIVLNQRTQHTAGGLPSVAVPDRQTLAFEFRRNGVAFDPVDVSITVFDISSQFTTNWRTSYYETVGFSVTPGSIRQGPGTVAGTDPGIGVGTLADPFRRSRSDLPTGSPPGRGPYVEVFSFGSFPSGSTMRFSQVQGYQGWHFVTISGISFSTPGCP